jgi:hypothetical protein
VIGLITLDEKCAGARSAGNPHAACEAEGTGNGATASRTEARFRKGSRKPPEACRHRASPRPYRDRTGCSIPIQDQIADKIPAQLTHEYLIAQLE